MSLPKRLYIAKCGGLVGPAAYKLKDALSVLRIEKGEKFSYRVYEGGNSVECEWLGSGKFRERRK